MVEPGFFRTNLGETRGYAKGLIRDYDELRTKAVEALKDEFQRGGDPSVVAKTVLRDYREQVFPS